MQSSRTHRGLVGSLAALVVLGTACQTAAPVAPTNAPATGAQTQATAAPPATQAAAPAVNAAPAATAAPTTPPPPTSVPPTPVPPTPTATPAPLARLAADLRAAAEEGRLAVASGDYVRAVAVLEPLQEQVEEPEARAEVRLLLGQAQVGAGQFDAALASSEAVLEGARQPDLTAAARLLKGKALRGQGQLDAAAVEMRAAADADPLVDAAIRLELTDMWLAEGNYAEAAADARKGLDTAQARLLKIELAERLGRAEVELKNTEAAMDAYRQLLTSAGTEGYLGEQLYNLAVGTSSLGRTDDAIRALRTSIAEFPRSRRAPEAVTLLESLGGMRAEDRFYAGRIRYLFWNFAGARADFDAYLTAHPDGEHAVEALYYRGLSTLPRESAQRLLDLADRYPDDDFAPLALLHAGKAYEELEEYRTAEQVYARLVDTFPTRDAGLDGTFRRGLARYMLGDYSGATASWQELLGRDPESTLVAQAHYWLGKAHQSRGDEAAARAEWEHAAAVRPVDYYVIRAQVELEPPPATANFDPTRVEPADEAALAAWFAEHRLSLDEAAREASAQPAYRRAVAMVRYGLYKQANWEHEIFRTLYLDDPAHLYWLAARFGELGLPNAQMRLGSDALFTATAEGQVSVLDVPLALQRVAFPIAFGDMMAPIARERGLDPLLFNALMRQESAFDPYAESVAKAKGLTQIIPQTGNEIANALGVRSFEQESLFQPRRSVEFGTWYFGQRMRRNGQVNRALASYNAGDGNVDLWTGPGRDDPDVFAEYVSFEETHDYVKRIYTYWMLGRYIWAGA